MTKLRRRAGLIGLSLALALATAACGGTGDNGGSGGAAVTGRIVVDGSSTVAPSSGACTGRHIKYQEFRIGLDGLAVVTSSRNTFLDTLTFKQRP